MAQCSTLLFGLIAITLQGRRSHGNPYYNHSLIEVYPADDLQMVSVQELYNFTDVEVLKYSRAHNDSLDILVPGEKVGAVKKIIKAHNLLYAVKNTDYGRALESWSKSRKKNFDPGSIFTYKSHHQIQEYITSVAAQHPNLVRLQKLGQSYEGRALTLVKISTNFNANNPIIFIDAGIHAREWITTNMAMYIIHRLTNDREAREKELNGVDFYILPLVNPDGYEYSRTRPENRLWRQTRSVYQHGCVGVDGNRNYGYKWAVSGVSHNPCDNEIYAGPNAFSEVETRSVRSVFKQNQPRIKLYVSVHAYGQYLVYPWGFTRALLPSTWGKLHTLANKVSAAVVEAGGLPFKVTSAGQWYPAAGGSDDFAFGEMGVPYSYTMEITNDHQFIYPEQLIGNVLPPLYEGFRTFSREIKNEFGRKSIYPFSSYMNK